ncbi:helix-turn-helix domain-containing protein [Bacillus altitudinis]|uniref:helix-turn-helix domain-containing protein n=1 Tax=Bacillus altitudinis TaxID=293387 RepID=UPI00331482DD
MDQLIKFVGSRLKELRKTQGWTQERLSQESGINPSYIADVERGERNITLKSFDRLINALMDLDLPPDKRK